MSDSDEMIALHPADFADVQSMHREWLTTRRPQAGVQRKIRRTTHDFMRVMIIDSDYPVYTPREERAVAYFVRDLTRQTISIEMFGDNLAGPVTVTIDGTAYTVVCQSSTAGLRAAFGFNLNYCRVTAFPGLWEFAFAGTAPTVTAEPAVGTSTTLTFSGGLVVTEEAWVSAADEQGRLLTIDVIDVIPFAEGEVKPGSVGVAMFAASSGWIVPKWYCREFQFLSLTEAEGGGDGSGVGEVVDPDGAPVDPEPVVDPPVEEEPP